MTPEQVLAALAEDDLPPATLVLGPGAWPLVGKAAGPDWLFRLDLSAGDAREVRDSAVWFPVHEGLRVFALSLDRASEQVQNMLLAILEDPPPGTCFVLAATERPLDTVVSRCRVLVLGAARPAPARLDPADSAAVAAALRAASSGHGPALAAAVRGWQASRVQVLAAWAAEAASGRWLRFAPGYAPGVSTAQALSLLTELSRYAPGTRLGAHAALERVFRRA